MQNRSLGFGLSPCTTFFYSTVYMVVGFASSCWSLVGEDDIIFYLLSWLDGLFGACLDVGISSFVFMWLGFGFEHDLGLVWLCNLRSCCSYFFGIFMLPLTLDLWKL